MLNERWITLLVFVGLLGLVWRVPALAAIGMISLVVLVASFGLRLRALKGIRYTRDFVQALYASAKSAVAKRRTLRQAYELTRRRLDPKYGAFPIYEHCMPFDVSRAYDEASGIKHPRIWTARRDIEMWKSIA